VKKLIDITQGLIDVSIVIPVRNGEGYINQALKSVINSFPKELRCEVIVSENYSTDNTKTELNQLKHSSLTVVTPPRPLNVAENWSFVCSLARGRYIKLLCADDLLLSSGLENEVQALDQNPTALATFAPRIIIGPKGKIVMERSGLKKFQGVQKFDWILKKSFLSGTNMFGEPGCALFRRNTLLSTLPWSLNLPYVIDLDFYIRALKGEVIFVMKDSTSQFRVHEGSVSRLLSKKQAKEFFSLLDKNSHIFQSNKYKKIIFLYIKYRTKINQFFRNIIYGFSSKFR
jgi:glycosyltransferase involved in cell wall biosynthesis